MAAVLWDWLVVLLNLYVFFSGHTHHGHKTHTHTWKRSVVKPLEASEKALIPITHSSWRQCRTAGTYTVQCTRTHAYSTHTWTDMNPNLSLAAHACSHSLHGNKNKGAARTGPQSRRASRGGCGGGGSFLNPIRQLRPWKGRSLTNQSLPD